MTAELGDPAAASSSRVQAELLRVVIPTTALAAGQLSQQTFTAAVLRDANRRHALRRERRDRGRQPGRPGAEDQLLPLETYER